jgi:membrane-associated phospholipid phosphatase
MIASWLCALALSAEPAPPPVTYELAVNLPVDVGVTTGELALWLVSETVFKKNLAPSSCHWCDRAADGTDHLNSVDAWGRGIRWAPAQLATADVLSSVLAFGVLPASMLGLDLLNAVHSGVARRTAIDTLIVLEAVMMASLTVQVTKFSVGRARPWVHALPPDQAAALGDPDANLSFFSGHSAFAFAAVVAMGVVAEERGYAWARWIWAVGLPLAALVPIMRMAADKHYLSDVLVGSAVGAAFGYGVPALLHRRVAVGPVTLTASPGPGGVSVGGSFR